MNQSEIRLGWAQAALLVADEMPVVRKPVVRPARQLMSEEELQNRRAQDAKETACQRIPASDVKGLMDALLDAPQKSKESSQVNGAAVNSVGVDLYSVKYKTAIRTFKRPAFEIGQKWRRRDGGISEIAKVEPWDIHGLESKCGMSYDLYGLVAGRAYTENGFDLIELISEAPAPTKSNEWWRDLKPGDHVVHVCGSGEVETFLRLRWDEEKVPEIETKNLIDRANYLRPCDAEGWIKHDGGECPIPGAKAGEYELKIDEEVVHRPKISEAIKCRWESRSGHRQITHYRLIPASERGGV